MKEKKTKSTEKLKGKEKNINCPKLDKELVSDILYQLNIARKNFLIYPPGHVQTLQSLKKCHALLHDLLESHTKITIGVAKDQLFVGNMLIEDKGHGIKDLALSVKHHELAGITFYRGISTDDLSYFFQLMAKSPEEIEILGGFIKILADKKIKTIKLQFIDYSAFHHTEEMEINRTKNRQSRSENSAIWTQFISGLLSGSLKPSGQEATEEQTGGIHPSQLALFLNEKKIDTEVALDNYRTIISRRLQDSGEPTPSSSTYAHDFSELDLLLKELNPKLKKQFLSATYNQVNSAGENEASKNLLTLFSEQVVLDMLKQANEDGEEISPSLMNLVYKITSAHDGMSHPEGDTNCNESANPHNLLFDTDPLQNVFTREKFEEYVTTDYENTLKNLSEDLDDEIVEAKRTLPIEDFHKELEPSHVNSQIAHIILAFMHNSIKPVEYGNYAAKLVDISYDLLRMGEFSTLLKILNALYKHYKNKTDPEIQSLAKNTLKTFREDRFLSMAVVSFEKWAKTEDTAAYEFLISLGSKVVPEIVALYGKGKRPEIQSLIEKLLNRFPEATCLEAKRRFRESQPSFVINMLSLVRKIGTEKDVPIVKKLLEHHDTDVRITALETLIELGDPDGSDVIRNFLRSIYAKEKLKAIQLIGTHKLVEMVPDLIARISRWTLFKSHYEKNEMIITALGKIGNPIALPVLEKLAKCKWAIWSKSLNRMKLAIYKSLHGYELSQITSLLNIGRRSQDNQIRQICKNIGHRN